MQPPSLPISQPIPSCKLTAPAQSQQQKEAVTPTAASPAVTPTMPRKAWNEPPPPASTAATALQEETAVAIAEGGEHVKHDLLVWFEILELGELIAKHVTFGLLDFIS